MNIYIIINTCLSCMVEARENLYGFLVSVRLYYLVTVFVTNLGSILTQLQKHNL